MLGAWSTAHKYATTIGFWQFLLDVFLRQLFITVCTGLAVLSSQFAGRDLCSCGRCGGGPTVNTHVMVQLAGPSDEVVIRRNNRRLADEKLTHKIFTLDWARRSG